MTISAERLDKSAQAYHRILNEIPTLASIFGIRWESLTPEQQDLLRQFANRVDQVQKTGPDSIPPLPPLDEGIGDTRSADPGAISRRPSPAGF